MFRRMLYHCVLASVLALSVAFVIAFCCTAKFVAVVAVLCCPSPIEGARLANSCMRWDLETVLGCCLLAISTGHARCCVSGSLDGPSGALVLAHPIP